MATTRGNGDLTSRQLNSLLCLPITIPERERDEKLQKGGKRRRKGQREERNTNPNSAKRLADKGGDATPVDI
jgi:hypothetical protein